MRRATLAAACHSSAGESCHGVAATTAAGYLRECHRDQEIPMTTLLLTLALTLACGDKGGTDSGAPGDGGGSDGGADGGGGSDGGADGGGSDGGADGGGSDGGADGGADGGGSDGGADGGGSDGGADLDYATGIDVVATDTTTFADAGYTWTTFEVGSDFERPFTSADGLPPRFNVVWPTTPDAGTAYPVVLVLHGASTDVDTKVPEGDYGRCTQEHGISEGTDMVRRSALIPHALAEGFVVVVPENSFCDGWAGLGPDDPVDTTHAGYFLEKVALGHLRWGTDVLTVDSDRIFGLGTSLGATGVPWFASHYDAVAGIVYDSGAPDFVRYTVDKDYSGVDLETRYARGTHIMGGEPYESDGVTESEWYSRYLHHSLDRGTAAGVLSTPAFVIFNTQDEVAPGDMYEGVDAVLDAALTPAGKRWTIHDVDHPTPMHTQIHSPSATYATWGAMQFLLGRHVAYVEAEGRTGSGWVGADVADTTATATASQGVVRESGRGEAGTLVELPLPADASGHTSVTVFLAINGGGDASADAVTLSLSSPEDGLVSSVTLSQDDGEWGSSATDAVRARLAASTVSGLLTGTGTVSVEVTGAAAVSVDVAVVDWE